MKRRKQILTATVFLSSLLSINVSYVSALENEYVLSNNLEAGREYLLVSQTTTSTKVMEGSSFKTCVVENNKVTSVPSTFEKCIFTTEVASQGYYYLKDSQNRYLTYTFYQSDDAYYYELSSTKYSAFKYNSDHYFEVKGYCYINNRDVESSRDTVFYAGFTGNNYTNVSSNASGVNKTVYLYQKDVQAPDTYYDVTIYNDDTYQEVMYTTSIKEGDAFTLPECTLTKKNHYFNGYKSDNGILYEENQEIIITSNLRLYCEFLEYNRYTIRFFDLNDNDLNRSFTIYENEKKYLDVGYALTGYKFLGWSIEKDDTVEYELYKTYTFNEDLILYPVLKKVVNDDKPSASIKLYNPTLRFKYDLNLNDIQNSFDTPIELDKLQMGVIYVEKTKLESVSSYCNLKGLLANHAFNIDDEVINLTISDTNFETTTYQSISLKNEKNTNPIFTEDKLTFSLEIDDYNKEEVTIRDFEEKKKLYNEDIYVVGYLQYNSKHLLLGQGSISYISAVNEYLSNRMYSLDEQTIAKLREIKKKYEIK